METDTAQLAALIDRKARRLQRDAAELRRLAAALKDTVEDTTTDTRRDTE